LAVSGVEVAGGLVGKEDFGAAGDGAGDGEALLFATGEVFGEDEFFTGEVDGGEGSINGLGLIGGGEVLDFERQTDVMLASFVALDEKALENEADLMGAEIVDFVLR